MSLKKTVIEMETETFKKECNPKNLRVGSNLMSVKRRKGVFGVCAVLLLVVAGVVFYACNKQEEKVSTTETPCFKVDDKAKKMNCVDYELPNGLCIRLCVDCEAFDWIDVSSGGKIELEGAFTLCGPCDPTWLHCGPFPFHVEYSGPEPDDDAELHKKNNWQWATDPNGDPCHCSTNLPPGVSTSDILNAWLSIMCDECIIFCP